MHKDLAQTKLYLLVINQILWWFIITDRSALWALNHLSFCPISLMVVYWTTMAITGNGELGFDSGEGAWETATISKEGSRRVNYPILIQGGS